MIDHLTALSAELAALAYPVHRIAATAVTGQYLVLGAKGWDGPVDLPMCGDDESLDTEVRVTAVAGTPDGVLIMLNRVRGVLSPGLSWAPLTVTGRVAQTKFERSEFVGLDRDVTITNTDRHPAVGVDSYRLVSEPAV